MRRLTVLLVVSALTLALAACGDDDSAGTGTDDTETTEATGETEATEATGETEATEATEATEETDDEGSDAAFVDAITAAVLADQPGAGAPLGETEARCMAEGIVDELGVEGLLELGLSVEAIEQGETLEDAALSEEQAGDIADATIGCLDIAELMAAQFPPGAVSDESLECLGDRLAEAASFRQFVIDGILGRESGSFEDADPETQVEFTEIITDCLTAEELVELGQQPG